MSNFSLKLDLSKFNGFGLIDLKGQSGQVKKCVVIPVEDNNLFLGDKGTYADLVCFETPNSDYGSHMVTISKTKEEQEHEKQSGERIRKPIVGNLKPFGSQTAENSGEEYSLPNQQPAQPQKTKKQQPADDIFSAPDLPF